MVLVGRELTLFMHLDASAVPVRQREAFVAMQVRRAAPFTDADLDVAWFGSHAAVWYWSRGRVRDLLVGTSGNIRLRAEGCFRGEPVEGDGIQLLSLAVDPLDGVGPDAGYEARVWKQGRLVVSRWWRGIPSEGVWRTFLRGSGLDPSIAVPPPQTTPVREQPLGGGLDMGALAERLRGNGPVLAGVAGALASAVLAWQLVSVAGVGREIDRVVAQTEPLEEELESIITARTRADEAAAEIQALLGFRPPASQTRLLAEVQQVTPPGDWAITVWHQPGPDTLEVTLQGTGMDASEIVAAWEQSPLLEEVTPSTGRRGDELTLRARLTPLEQQS